MKVKSPLRVFVVFAVGIILPSAFLSYLGFRSFRYEGLLMQKQTEDRYAALADVIQKQAEEKLEDLRSALRALSRSDSFRNGDRSRMTIDLAAVTRLNNLPLESLFVFDDQDRLIIPPLPDPLLNADKPVEVEWGRLRERIDSLERLEFVDKRIAQAVEGYQAIDRKALPPLLQAALLKNIAGGYRKLHQDRDAEKLYLELGRRYDRVPDASGLPMGVLARQMLTKLYSDENASERASETRLELAEGLILGRWGVSSSRRDRLLQELRGSLQKATTGESPASGELRVRWERLKALQVRLDQLTPAAQAFARNEASGVLSRLRRHGWLEEGGILQITGPGDAKRLAIAAPLFSPAEGPHRGLLLAIVSGDVVWPVIDRSLMELAVPAGLQLAWDHSTPSRSGLWTPSLERQVNRVDPPLRIRLSETHSADRDLLARRRLWIYGGMVGLSFVVILVGLVAMGQAIRREVEVSEMKANFVANVSHELRTPLTAISYIGERLTLGRYRSEEERKQFYGMLEEETRRLRGLVEDILDFSKILAGKKEYQQEPLRLVAVVQEAYERFQGKAQAKDFELSLEVPAELPPVRGDRRALLQAILNVFDNALKYSGDSRRADVRVRAAADRVVVAVQDYGIGISDREKEKIFEKFYRVEHAAAQDAAGGVGLGLAMVKHVMEGHQGGVTVESQLGKGSLFTLWLPLTNGGSNGSHPGH